MCTAPYDTPTPRSIAQAPSLTLPRGRVHDAEMDGQLLPIGMFSPASSLSIKTLRAYHESGILVPARVDPQTGYRSYTVDQLADAAIVQRLRALDLPLEQVRTVVDARDPDVTRQVLAGHQREMQSRLDETERIVAELQSLVAPTTHTPVHLRAEAATQSVRIAGLVQADEFAAWLGWAYGELHGFLERRRRRAVGTAGRPLRRRARRRRPGIGRGVPPHRVVGGGAGVRAARVGG